MPHSIRHGAFHGLIRGVRHNVSIFGGATKDATSGIYVPASAIEWTNIGIQAPGYGWLCQEASGNLADTIDSTPLAVSSSPSFRQAVTGWSRQGVKITATTLQKFSATAGSGPNPAATSVAWLAYVASTTTPGSQRGLLCASDGASHDLAVDLNNASKLVLVCNTVTASSVQTYVSSAVYPILLVYNRTAGTVTLYTNAEQLSGTYNAGVVDGNKGLGALHTGTSAANVTTIFMAAWTGANAESLDKTTLQKLGWSLSY